jgi:hypothetical protein
MKRRRKRILPIDSETTSAPMPTPVTGEVQPPVEEPVNPPVPPVEEIEEEEEELPQAEEVKEEELPQVEEVKEEEEILQAEEVKEEEEILQAEEVKEEVTPKPAEPVQLEEAKQLQLLLALEGASEPLTVAEVKALVGFVPEEKQEFKYNLSYITACGWVNKVYLKNAYHYKLSKQGAKKITELMS